MNGLTKIEIQYLCLPTISPLTEAHTMESVRTWDSDQPCDCRVHAFQADWTGRKFVGRWWYCAVTSISYLADYLRYSVIVFYFNGRYSDNMACFRLDTDDEIISMLKESECYEWPTSIELKGLPLYSSIKSLASSSLVKRITTIERLGAESL